jgi:hypothetical protein
MLTAQTQQCSSKQSDMSGGVMHSSGYSLDVFGDDRMMTSFQGICLSDKLGVNRSRTLIYRQSRLSPFDCHGSPFDSETPSVAPRWSILLIVDVQGDKQTNPNQPYQAQQRQNWSAGASQNDGSKETLLQRRIESLFFLTTSTRSTYPR